MKIQWLAVILSMLLMAIVLELVRRNRLTFRYAMAWLFIGLGGILGALFHQVIFNISVFFGFELPSNFIFFVLFGVFIFLSLLLTVFLCQQHNRNDRMSQHIALLEEELRQLREKSRRSDLS